MLAQLRRRLQRHYLLVLAIALSLYALGSFALAAVVLTNGLDDDNRRLLDPAASGYATLDWSLPKLKIEFTEFVLDRDEHAAILDPAGRVLDYRGPRPAPAELPTRLGARTEGHLRVYVMPLERDGVRSGYLLIARSLHDIRRALAALALAFAATLPLVLLLAGVAGWWLSKRSAAPVEAAIAREREFTRDASHELRTPLAVIQLQAQLAHEVAGLPEPARARLESVIATSRRMSALLGDLLSLAREDAGLQGEALRFSLAEVLEETLDELGALAESRAVAIRRDDAFPDAFVQGAPVRLGRAVSNLLDNALRYTPAGGHVAVRLASEGGWHVLTIANTGAPIPDAARARIFERFMRTDEARAANPGGTGLGLPFARAVAQAHGGTLELLPPDADGNAFALRLPAG